MKSRLQFSGRPLEMENFSLSDKLSKKFTQSVDDEKVAATI